MNTFSFKKALLKGIKVFVLFGIPVLIDQFVIKFPDLAQLSVGGILYIFVNWLKVKYGFRLP